MSLPFNQLLSKTCDRESMFVPSCMKLLLMTANTFGVVLQLLSRRFQVLAPLAGVAVQFGEVLAELFPTPEQAFQGRFAAGFKVGHLCLELGRFRTCRRKVRPVPLRCFPHLVLLDLERQSLRLQRLAVSLQSLEFFVELLPLGGKRVLTLGDVRRELLELGGVRRELEALGLQAVGVGFLLLFEAVRQ